MILSASRRTDIPTLFSDWFLNRLKEKSLLIRNPMNQSQISQIDLSPNLLDGIVFWTKNPIPMLPRLGELGEIPYYFQWTVSPYGREIEPNVPSKQEVILPEFQKLAKKIGSDRLVWRYDPIALSDVYTVDFHKRRFQTIAQALSGSTDTCVFSFLDEYPSLSQNPKFFQKETQEQILELVHHFAEVTKQTGLKLQTCAEIADLSQFGVTPSHCIDGERLEKIGDFSLQSKKDKNQRKECACIESIDIGLYNSCSNGCLYCYANKGQSAIARNLQNYDPLSPLLCDTLREGETPKERPLKSCQMMRQESFF